MNVFLFQSSFTQQNINEYQTFITGFLEVVNFGTPLRHNSYAPGTGIFKMPDAQALHTV